MRLLTIGSLLVLLILPQRHFPPLLLFSDLLTLQIHRLIVSPRQLVLGLVFILNGLVDPRAA